MAGYPIAVTEAGVVNSMGFASAESIFSEPVFTGESAGFRPGFPLGAARIECVKGDNVR